MFKRLALLVAFAAALPAMAQADKDPAAVLAGMQGAVSKLDGYRAVQLKRERFGDQLSPPEVLALKCWRGQVYLHVLSGPRQGAEAIWRPEAGKVHIHKGSFPDITLDLDPHGALMMDGQHHPIEHACFGHLVDVLLANVRAAQDGGRLRDLGETQVQGRPADVVELSAPWRTRPYVVQRGDELWSLAARLGVDPFVLLHESGMTRPGALKAGAVLRVPQSYGSRSVVAVDRATHLPARLEVYDGKGRLYELYEWSQIDVRTPLSAADFDPKNPAYHY